VDQQPGGIFRIWLGEIANSNFDKFFDRRNILHKAVGLFREVVCFMICVDEFFNHGIKKTARKPFKYRV
jgi:hypothetical protein